MHSYFKIVVFSFFKFRFKYRLLSVELDSNNLKCLCTVKIQWTCEAFTKECDRVLDQTALWDQRHCFPTRSFCHLPILEQRQTCFRMSSYMTSEVSSYVGFCDAFFNSIYEYYSWFFRIKFEIESLIYIYNNLCVIPKKDRQSVSRLI